MSYKNEKHDTVYSQLSYDYWIIHVHFLGVSASLWIIPICPVISLCTWNNKRTAGHIIMTFDIGEFNEKLSSQLHINLHHAVLTDALFEDVCFCMYLESSWLNIYWTEKSYIDKWKTGYIYSSFFLLVLQFSRELKKFEAMCTFPILLKIFCIINIFLFFVYRFPLW